MSSSVETSEKEKITSMSYIFNSDSKSTIMSTVVGIIRSVGIHFWIIIFCHYSFQYFRQAFPMTLAFKLGFLLYYEFVMWFTITIFLFLDLFSSSSFKATYKLKEIRPFYTKFEMFTKTVKNEVILCLLIFLCIDYVIDIEKLASLKPSLALTFIWIILCYFLFETIFYLGHRLMHVNPTVFKLMNHQDHHLTFATDSLSCHFMGWWDYFMEVVLPVVGGLLILSPLGLPAEAFISFSCFGIVNTVIVHSGYDFAPFLPNPVFHYIHHSKHSANLGLGVFDRFAGTWQEKLDG